MDVIVHRLENDATCKTFKDVSEARVEDGILYVNDDILIGLAGFWFRVSGGMRDNEADLPIWTPDFGMM